MIVGVDPGAKGAFGFVDERTGELLDVVDMPTITADGKTRVAAQAIALLIAANKPTHAYVERVGAMPKQGVSSTFVFGQAVGAVDGVLAALGVPVTYVTAAQWKREMRVTKDKGSSRRRAMELAPTRASLFGRVKDDGRAEAYLLAVHGLRGRLREAA